jgi:hypothetical protein
MANKMLVAGVGSAIVFPMLEKGLKKLLPALFQSSGVAGLPKAFGITIGAVAVSSFWLTLYGFGVGAARKKYMTLAQKDGEKDTEARYSLPNLYVDGNTKHSQAFNCVQRSHQQAFETLPQLYAFTFSAALVFPVSAACNVTLWLYGRMKWSKAYAESGGDPSKRYDHPLAFFIFSSFLSQFILAMTAAFKIGGIVAA